MRKIKGVDKSDTTALNIYKKILNAKKSRGFLKSGTGKFLEQQPKQTDQVFFFE